MECSEEKAVSNTCWKESNKNKDGIAKDVEHIYIKVNEKTINDNGGRTQL